MSPWLKGFFLHGAGGCADPRKDSATRVPGDHNGIRDAFIFPLNPPPIRELGNATGFSLRLQDRGGVGHEALLAARNQLLGMARQSKVVTGMRPDGLEDAPQLQLVRSSGILNFSLNLLEILQQGKIFHVYGILDKGRVLPNLNICSMNFSAPLLLGDGATILNSLLLE